MKKPYGFKYTTDKAAEFFLKPTESQFVGFLSLIQIRISKHNEKFS